MSPLTIDSSNVEPATMVRVNGGLVMPIYRILMGEEAVLAIGEYDPEGKVRGGKLQRPAREYRLKGEHDGGTVDGTILSVDYQKELERGVIVRGERKF